MENKKSKKIEHVWTLLCSGSSIDRQTNNLTIYNAIEQLNVIRGKQNQKTTEGEITFPVSLQMITLWKIPDGQKISVADVEIDFLDPTKKALMKIKYKLEVPANVKRVRSLGTINGLKVTKSGDYTFVIGVKPESQTHFERIAEVSLEINIK